MPEKATGFEKIARDLTEAQEALTNLDGSLATMLFDPTDPESVNRAIREMEEAIDAKVAPYKDNELVQRFAEGSKEAFRKAILKRADEAKA